MVKVDAMLKMFKQLSTPENKKVKVAFPEAGDHVIACELFSGAVDRLFSETIKFGKDVLRLPQN
jgi:hypothetical protein